MPDLPEDTHTSEAPEAPPKRRRIYKILILFGLVWLGVLWLSGPGFRLIAPWVTLHYLEKLGIRGDFKVEGNVVRGITVSELVIEGDEALGKLTVERVVPEYSFKGLREGRLEGLTFEGVHADLRLGAEKDEAEKKPFDLNRLLEQLEAVRTRLAPMDLAVKDFSLTVLNDQETPMFQLGSSHLIHEKNGEVFKVQLGGMTDAAGRDWPAREAQIVWKDDRLALDRLDLLPGISLRDLIFEMPAGAEPSMEAMVRVDDSVFTIQSPPGLSSVKMDLLEGGIPLSEISKRFGRELPASASLTSFSLELDQLLPNPRAATGNLRVLLENVTWGDWTSPELGVDVSLGADDATLAARGIFQGSAISIHAAAPVSRGEIFEIGDVAGTLNLADFPGLLQGLSSRTGAIDPSAPVPPSSVDGNFSASLKSNRIEAVRGEILVKPEDPALASGMKVQGRWEPDRPLTATLSMDGLDAEASYQPIERIYQAKVVLDEFQSDRLDAWLAIFRVRPDGVGSLTGTWSGGGELQRGRHRGELALTQGTWSREAMEPVTAVGTARYDWPAGFGTTGLRVAMGRQTVAMEAQLKDQILSVPRFKWSLGEQSLAQGEVRLPVPENLARWRETLAGDERPITVVLKTEVLSLGLLKGWVPALGSLHSESTGQLDLAISGTYSNPEIEAKLDAKGLRSPARPNLPPADLSIGVKAREGRIHLEGTATAADFPAALIQASMPFRPADWAKVPAALSEEPVDARVDLPRLDLSRFTTLIPAAERLSGNLSGKILMGGKIGKPEMLGTVELTGGGITLKSSRIPPIEGMSASLDLSLNQIVLKNLRATVAGGSVQGEGNLLIADGKPGELDLRLRASHLPVVRNELLLVRANSDLRVRGPWERAEISGSVNTVDSIFYRDIELLPIGRPFTAPSAAAIPKFDVRKDPTSGIPEPFRNWTLNVTAAAVEPVLIRGNFANGEVRGKVRLGGTLGVPAPDGTLTIRDFRASLPFSTLFVRSGTATFTPDHGFDPILEIRGTAEPRPYRVTVYAYGRASDPQLVLTSNPPLPENEIMTLLATGTTTSGLEDPQAASSRALQLLVEEMRRGRFRFGRSLRPVLALLDRVDFSLAEADPYTSESYSTATLSITDRWFLSAGIGATGDTRVLAIWRLSFR